MFYSQMNRSRFPEGKPEDNVASQIEIMVLLTPFVCEIFITLLLTSLLFNKLDEKFIQKYGHYIQFILEFILIIIPIMFSLTILSSTYLHSYMIMLAFLMYCCYVIHSKIRYKVNYKQKIELRRPFITNVRCMINLTTVFAILAVDFWVFPERFSKTVFYGYSLMDIGVGLYVFSNGIVAPELHKRTDTVRKSVINSIPLIAIGVVRFIMTTSVNYDVSENEYGVHWNFFITLAATKIMSSLILNVFKVKYSLHIAVVTFVIYEFLLLNGLETWILDETTKRDNFIKANREGIFSTVGYVGLYFLSMSIGKVMNRRYSGRSNDSSLILILLAFSLFFVILNYVISEKLELVWPSRRLANTSYCLWIVFVGVYMSLFCLIVENLLTYLYKKHNVKNQIYVPFLVEAASYNALPFFLVANVMTGIVNLIFPTLLMSALPSMVILFTYMLLNCLFISVLYVKNIKITSLLGL